MAASALWSAVVSRTRPRRTCRVASPGLSCSARAEPAVSAMRVCRSACSCPPWTVCALRPASTAWAAANCSSARAVNDSVAGNWMFSRSSESGQAQIGLGERLEALDDDRGVHGRHRALHQAQVRPANCCADGPDDLEERAVPQSDHPPVVRGPPLGGEPEPVGEQLGQQPVVARAGGVHPAVGGEGHTGLPRPAGGWDTRSTCPASTRRSRWNRTVLGCTPIRSARSAGPSGPGAARSTASTSRRRPARAPAAVRSRSAGARLEFTQVKVVSIGVRRPR